MTRETLDRKINDILDGVVELSSLVEQSILDAVEAMEKKDLVAAKRIYDADSQINDMRYMLEEKTVGLIARHQPVASDVRILTAVLEVITELERMGDYAKGVAKVAMLIGEEPYIISNDHFVKMAQSTADMLHRAIKAFIDRDEKTAKMIPDEDEEVDEYYYAIYTDLIKAIASDPLGADQANNLLWAAHNIERTADRVTYICERTIYIETGLRGDIDTTDDELRKFNRSEK